ncbi:hypothetical protein C8J57DRAFT_1538633 [Mycena rebaudengoi]|nr:hypothetical protein C8J57DRAFT_1538633 [Mycena rebaudengoi]
METANCAQSISENGIWAETANYWYFGTNSSLLTAAALYRGLPHFLILRGMFNQLQYALYQRENALHAAVKAGMNQGHQTHRALDAGDFV